MAWSVGRVVWPARIGLPNPPFPSIPEAVAVWIADDIAQSDGSSVASWVDRISAFDLAQATGASQPTYETGGIRGHPAVYFDNSILVYAAANAVSTATSGAVFVVAEFAGFSGSAQAMWASTNTAGTNNTSRVWGRIYTPGVLVEQRNAGDTTDAVEGLPLPSTDVPALVEWRSSGSAYAFEVDGSGLSTSVVSGADTGDWFGDTASRGNFTVGAIKTTSSEAEFWNGRIAAVVVCDGTVSGGSRAAILAWRLAKYGT